VHRDDDAYQQRVLILEARVPLGVVTVPCTICSTCDLCQYTNIENLQQTTAVATQCHQHAITRDDDTLQCMSQQCSDTDNKCNSLLLLVTSAQKVMCYSMC